MAKFKAETRVRYCETDQMQYLHHARYVEFFEYARTEMLRHYGLPYSKIEKDGYIMPVISVSANYKAPAYYDDLLEIEVIMPAVGGPRVHIEYIVRNKNTGKFLANGHSDLAFVSMQSNKPCKMPIEYVELLNRD